MEKYIKGPEIKYESKKPQMPATSLQESVLEQITSSYTKMPGTKSGDYNIDNCPCPSSCGCLQGNLLLVVSPVGIVGLGGLHVASAPIE